MLASFECVPFHQVRRLADPFYGVFDEERREQFPTYRLIPRLRSRPQYRPDRVSLIATLGDPVLFRNTTLVDDSIVFAQSTSITPGFMIICTFRNLIYSEYVNRSYASPTSDTAKMGLPAQSPAWEASPSTHSHSSSLMPFSASSRLRRAATSLLAHPKLGFSRQKIPCPYRRSEISPSVPGRK